MLERVLNKNESDLNNFSTEILKESIKFNLLYPQVNFGIVISIANKILQGNKKLEDFYNLEFEDSQIEKMVSIANTVHTKNKINKQISVERAKDLVGGEKKGALFSIHIILRFLETGSFSPISDLTNFNINDAIYIDMSFESDLKLKEIMTEIFKLAYEAINSPEILNITKERNVLFSEYSQNKDKIHELKNEIIYLLSDFVFNKLSTEAKDKIKNIHVMRELIKKI